MIPIRKTGCPIEGKDGGLMPLIRTLSEGILKCVKKCPKDTLKKSPGCSSSLPSSFGGKAF
jgi:hypothetical protein